MSMSLESAFQISFLLDKENSQAQLNVVLDVFRSGTN